MKKIKLPRLMEYAFEKYTELPLGKGRYLLFLLGISTFSALLALSHDKFGVYNTHGIDFYSACELSSLLVSLVSCWYYYFSVTALGQRWATICVFITWFASFFLHLAGICFVLRHDYFGVVLCTFGIAYSYGMIDHLIGHLHQDEEQKDEYLTSFLLADIPAIAGIGVLLVASLFRSSESFWGPFVSGASAIHLIICNITFFIIQLEIHEYDGK